uniref:Uncharacterized protein n=1 Tax=Romanomermis culicivorax TaxID=13658 RepID=A0A915K7K2_ROMCU
MERLLDTVKESVVIANTVISKECGSSGEYIPTLVQQTNDSDDVNNSHLDSDDRVHQEVPTKEAIVLTDE